MNNSNTELKVEELDTVVGGDFFNNFNNAAVAATNPGITLLIGGSLVLAEGLSHIISTPRSEL